MDNIEQWIPADLRKVVAHRSRLWHTFDQTYRRFKDMEQQSPQVASGPLVEISPPLSQEDTPPTEVLAAVAHFDEQLQKINKNNAIISNHQEEIIRLKHRQRTLIGVAIIVFALLMFAIINDGASVINSFFQ
jgi:hypothetical protein